MRPLRNEGREDGGHVSRVYARAFISFNSIQFVADLLGVIYLSIYLSFTRLRMLILDYCVRYQLVYSSILSNPCPFRPFRRRRRHPRPSCLSIVYPSAHLVLALRAQSSSTSIPASVAASVTPSPTSSPHRGGRTCSAARRGRAR